MKRKVLAIIVVFGLLLPAGRVYADGNYNFNDTVNTITNYLSAIRLALVEGQSPRTDKSSVIQTITSNLDEAIPYVELAIYSANQEYHKAQNRASGAASCACKNNIQTSKEACVSACQAQNIALQETVEDLQQMREYCAQYDSSIGTAGYQTFYDNMGQLYDDIQDNLNMATN